MSTKSAVQAGDGGRSRTRTYDRSESNARSTGVHDSPTDHAKQGPPVYQDAPESTQLTAEKVTADLGPPEAPVGPADTQPAITWQGLHRAINDGIDRELGRLGSEHKLPRFSWSFSAVAGAVSGHPSRFDYNEAAGESAATAWATALGLSERTKNTQDATVTYCGTLCGLAVRVWYTTSWAAFDAAAESERVQ